MFTACILLTLGQWSYSSFSGGTALAPPKPLPSVIIPKLKLAAANVVKDESLPAEADAVVEVLPHDAPPPPDMPNQANRDDVRIEIETVPAFKGNGKPAPAGSWQNATTGRYFYKAADGKTYDDDDWPTLYKRVAVVNACFNRERRAARLQARADALMAGTRGSDALMLNVVPSMPMNLIPEGVSLSTLASPPVVSYAAPAVSYQAPAAVAVPSSQSAIPTAPAPQSAAPQSYYSAPVRTYYAAAPVASYYTAAYTSAPTYYTQAPTYSFSPVGTYSSTTTSFSTGGCVGGACGVRRGLFGWR